MVRKLYLFIVTGLFFSSFFLEAELASKVDVTAGMLQDGIYENQPIKGIVTITHPESLTIDQGTFRMGNEKLAVDFIKDVKVSAGDASLLSIYHFELTGKPQGSYTLPQVSVEVGGKVYRSIKSVYIVMPKSEGLKAFDREAPPKTPQQPSGEQQAEQPAPQDQLQLKAGTDPEALYPGQKATFFYRYIFKGNIGLTVEKIPLLDAAGFAKIGEKEIKDSVHGETSVREISQVVQAIKPGTYLFGPSLIEGFAYVPDSLGNPVYTSKKLSSEAPVVEVVVLPFPKEFKPASFNGAVGTFTFKASLNSDSSKPVDVGDTLDLSIAIRGKGNLGSLLTPDLCCQPGFSGFFQPGDLPPKETVQGDTKTATVPLRILTDKVEAIPRIEFSYFEPEAAKYVVLHSEPIPIEVRPPSKRGGEPKVKKAAELTVSSKTVPIEIETMMPLDVVDLHHLPFGSWWALAIVPLGFAWIAFQYHLKDYIKWKAAQVVPVTSKELIAQAFQRKGECQFEVLKKALYLALEEKRFLPDDDLSVQVDLFLAKIDEMRFGQAGLVDVVKVKEEANALYQKIIAFGGV